MALIYSEFEKKDSPVKNLTGRDTVASKNIVEFFRRGDMN